MTFSPSRVLFEKEALEYPLGKSLYQSFLKSGVKVSIIVSHNRVTGIPGRTPQEAYREAKKTLVFGVRKTLKFQTCKPSAHYQLPLTTSCPGKCEYCYLMTSLPAKPYIRAYINIEEILAKAKEYIAERVPDITLFEGSATSDPIPVEKYTGALEKTIRFFAGQDYGRFRFVTKFTEVDSLLNIWHNGHTTFRFSLNIPKVIEAYEHGTPPLEERLQAAQKVAEAGYPMGFIIAPIIAGTGWETDYQDLLKLIRSKIKDCSSLSFEFITHRFTQRAKGRILEVFPTTTLPLSEEENRRFKFGQFGYGKYIYTQELMEEMKNTLYSKTAALFPDAKIEYFV